MKCVAAVGMEHGAGDVGVAKRKITASADVILGPMEERDGPTRIE